MNFTTGRRTGHELIVRLAQLSIRRPLRSTKSRKRKPTVSNRLFLEEIDKFKLDSDFQRNEFWALLEALEPNNGQIVATSNLNRKDLEARLGAQHGPAILRRIEGLPNGIYIDFSSAEIIKPFDPPVDTSAAAAVAGASAVALADAAPPPADVASEVVKSKPKLKFDKTGRLIG